MTMPRLNRREENEDLVISALKKWFKTHSYSPSYRDLSEATGLGLGTVHSACHDLRDEGYVAFEDSTARTIKLL